MESFKDNESGYVGWLQSHPEGFVFNRFGGMNPAYNILHRAGCSFLRRECDEGTRTVVQKWCSSSEAELASYADSELGRGMWKRCGVCFREGNGGQAEFSRASTHPIEETLEDADAMWIAGEPAVWLGSGEEEWKQEARTAFEAFKPEALPEWLDIELRVPQEKLFAKDLDNMLTPLLESARDAGWIERGFNRLGSVTSRKIGVADGSQAGALVKWHSTPPDTVANKMGILISVGVEALDADTVKWSLYKESLGLYTLRSDLRFPPGHPVSLDIVVTVNNDQRRKSLQALMKFCIDGLEPILGHPDNLPPVSRQELGRRLAPQDEMVTSLAFHVRGGDANRVSVVLQPANSPGDA